MSILPAHWTSFVQRNNLTGKEIEISEKDDLSGVGAVFTIMSVSDAEDEATKFYPGMIVKSDGYIPACGCSIGTGDQYFINLNDKVPGPLYRIYHDEVRDSNYDRARAIDVVLNCYEDILKFVQ